jgi:protein-disulfide isomerase
LPVSIVSGHAAVMRLVLVVAAVALASVACKSSSDAGASDPIVATGVPVDAGSSPSEGPDAANVVVVEFGDFECPFCGEEAPVVDQMLKDEAGRIRFVFKEFPLSAIHQYAELAAEAALAADAQGEFWPYHDLLYANQSALARSDLDAYAKQLGLDMTKFDDALDKGTYTAAVAADETYGESLGVEATPTFFVNGTEIVGAVALSTLEHAIAEQLDAGR